MDLTVVQYGRFPAATLCRMTPEDPARGPESTEPPADLEPDADLEPAADLAPPAAAEPVTDVETEASVESAAATDARAATDAQAVTEAREAGSPAAVVDDAARGRTPLLRSWVSWAVGGLVVLVAILVVAIVASGGDDDQPPGATASGGTTQARSAVDATAAWRAGLVLLDASKYGDYWGTWTSASQKSLTRDEYVALLTPCHNPGGAAAFAGQLQLTVEGDDAFLPLNKSARGGPVLHYENSQWRRVVDTTLVRTNPCGAAPD